MKRTLPSDLCCDLVSITVSFSCSSFFSSGYGGGGGGSNIMGQIIISVHISQHTAYILGLIDGPFYHTHISKHSLHSRPHRWTILSHPYLKHSLHSRPHRWTILSHPYLKTQPTFSASSMDHSITPISQNTAYILGLIDGPFYHTHISKHSLHSRPHRWTILSHPYLKTQPTYSASSMDHSITPISQTQPTFSASSMDHSITPISQTQPTLSASLKNHSITPISQTQPTLSASLKNHSITPISQNTAYILGLIDGPFYHTHISKHSLHSRPHRWTILSHPYLKTQPTYSASSMDHSITPISQTQPTYSASSMDHSITPISQNTAYILGLIDGPFYHTHISTHSLHSRPHRWTILSHPYLKHSLHSRPH